MSSYILIKIPHIRQKSKLGKLFLNTFFPSGNTNPEFIQKEEKAMDCHANKSIECTVHQCAHHCENENYCSLDRILVGTHEVNPTMDQCTDCKSFRKR